MAFFERTLHAGKAGTAALFRTLLALIVALTLAPDATAEEKFSFASTFGQLPKNVVPQHYDLTITPDMKTLTFKGSESITIDVKVTGNTIVVNALDLNITRALLDGEPKQKAAVKLDQKEQTATLTFPENLRAGQHKLQLEFEGKLGEQSQGLYYAKYQTDQGEKVMLATQMEPTDARRMFPCWDEPVFRTTYQLTTILPQKFTAVSNMPIESEKAGENDSKIVTFGRTPQMSSYLMVLVAGELESLAGEAEGVQLRVVTTEGKKAQGQYALEAAKKLLPFFNEYFGFKYSLPKLDLIAVPGGFGGAMENWGGITFNESILLFDPKTSSQATQQAIFDVLSHEMAHQWFGNLVTMAWWDNLWLNEGFASWMATKATAHFNPEWDYWTRANSTKSYVMGNDAQKTTHPIQQRVTNPSEAARVFDEITYLKGQAFIRMLEAYLGESAFRQGIRSYITAHQFSNTTTVDLWDALGKASGKPVREVAAGWTEQPGFPLISVSSTCQDKVRQLTLEQKRFTVNDPNPSPLEWQVPVAIGRVGSNDAAEYVLLNKKATLPVGDCQSPVKLNISDVGYYRVSYDPATFAELVNAAKSKLSDADRLNLMSDAWALAEAGLGSSTAYLDVVEAVRGENSVGVWEQIIGRLLTIDNLQIKRPGREAFRAYGRSVLSPVLARISWDAKPGEQATISVLRSRLIGALGVFKDEAVIAEARNRFRAFLQNPQSLPADLRGPVFSVVGRYGDKVVYDQLHALGRQSRSTEEKRQFYGAMQGALDARLAEENLRLALTDELAPTDAAYSLFRVAVAGEHAELALEFAKKHMKELQGKLSAFGSNAYAPSLFEVFSESARADELEAYAKLNLPIEAQPDVAKSAESIRSAAAFKARELIKIDQWITLHAK
ncbi:MAG: M1 family metallopeptidase [Pyrinomonadaceae bacterium]